MSPASSCRDTPVESTKLKLGGVSERVYGLLPRRQNLGVMVGGGGLVLKSSNDVPGYSCCFSAIKALL